MIGRLEAALAAMTESRNARRRAAETLARSPRDRDALMERLREALKIQED